MKKLPLWLQIVIGLATLTIVVFLPPEQETKTITFPTPTPESPQIAGIQTYATAEAELATFLKVVDGDTIHVLLNGEKKVVRIIGINTPETVDPRKDVECFGKEASAFAQTFFTTGSGELWLVPDSSQSNADRYQRLLRYVTKQDTSEDYGEMALRRGFAYEYTYDEPYSLQAKYRQQQVLAEQEQVGLWSNEACRK